MRRRSSSGVSREEGRSGLCGSFADVFVLASKSKMAKQTNAGAYVGRSAMMHCPPRGFGYSLRVCFPSAPCFPRFLGKRARIGMSRAAPGCCRLLPASSAPELLAAPGDSQFLAIPSALGLPASRASWALGKTPTKVSQASNASLAAASSCCRSSCRRHLSKF